MSYSEQIEEMEQRIYDLRRAQDKEECEENNHKLYLVEAFTFNHLNGRIIHRRKCECGRDEETVFKDTGEVVTAEAYKFPPDEEERRRRFGISSHLWVEMSKASLLMELMPMTPIQSSDKYKEEVE